MSGKTIFEVLGITALIAVIFGGFYFLYTTIQNNNAVTQAEIANLNSGAANAGGGGLGGIITGVLGLLGV